MTIRRRPAQAASLQPANATAPILRASGIKKVFGGAVALAAGALEVRAGEIHALLGENGAGKSTLVRILAGVEQLDGGRIEVHGTDVTDGYNPARAEELGICVIHQQLALVGELTVAENIALIVGYGPGFVRQKDMEESARKILQPLGVEIDPAALVSSLPMAHQSLVAIARALAVDAKVLILDEPTAALNPRESDALFAVLHRLTKNGTGVVLISHRLDEVLEHAETVTVLRDGQMVHAGATAAMTMTELVECILGVPSYSLNVLPTPRSAPSVSLASSTPTLELVGVELEQVQHVSLKIFPGEVLGVTGLIGSGYSSIGRAVYGRERPRAGHMSLSGRPYKPQSPAAAKRNRVGYIPGNRNEEALIPGLTVRENLNPAPSITGGVLNRKREQAWAGMLSTFYDIRPRGTEKEISELSGGNAQKVVIARIFHSEPVLVVLEEPTAGVDIGARNHIHRLIAETCASGVAVMLVSSDIDEVAVLSSRVAVVADGRIVDLLTDSQINVQSIVKAVNGGAE